MALGLLESPSRDRPWQGFSHVRITINRELESLFNTQVIHTQVQRIVEEGEDIGARQEEDYCCWEITYYFGDFTVLVLILSLRKLRGFILYRFPEEKNCVHYLLCLIVVLVILSFKDPNNASLKLKNQHAVVFHLMFSLQSTSNILL